jgi:uncharacterized protein YdaU (DUF1376 family)/ribosomal protein S17
MKLTTANKDPLIHFPFYINQYQGILSRYSLEEKGAFISLLCVYIVEDSQLPQNQDQLFRMCLAFSDNEKQAILSVKDKVIETGLEILKYQKEKREKCRESARIGGLARVAKAQAIAQETLKRPSSNTEKETETETEKETEKELKSKTSNPLTEDFQKFWEDYTPVKVSDGKVVPKGSRKTALIAYERARKKHGAEKIYEGAAKYLVNCYENNRLSCQAVVFLNQERFLDDYQQTNLEVKKHD